MDHSSLDPNQDSINDELTALASMFQEDLKIISEAPELQFQINLRPYSNVSSTNVSAALLVRFLPGYPHKCPEIHINPDEGLSQKDSDQLLSLLIEQANTYARDGQAMIHILVEAAQQFLSEINPLNPATKSANVMYSSKSEKSKFSVCSSVDLFSDLSGDLNWEINNTEVKNAETEGKNILLQPKNILLQENISVKIPSSQNLPRPESVQEISSKLDSVAEESNSDEVLMNYSPESDNNNSDDHIKGEEAFDSQHSASSSLALVPNDDDLQSKKKDLLSGEEAFDSQHSTSSSLASVANDGDLQSKKKVLILASSQFSQIFKTDSYFKDDNSTKSNSRYVNDFEELLLLGYGGFGSVTLCQNKLDGRPYAVKRIRLKDENPLRKEKILRILYGGLLEDRMKLVSKLWNANIRADFVPVSDPSMKDQYEYAREHDFKCLVIITESDLFKVRHLELKKEKELQSEEEMVNFLIDATFSQFRNLTIWG